MVPTGEDLAGIRAATLCLVNRERAATGARPLQPNAGLQRAADSQAENMALDDYFGHLGPAGESLLARTRAVGYLSGSQVGYEVGENIAWGTLSFATPRAIVAAWMGSPGHRENILDPSYRDTAIGVAPQAPASLAHGQVGATYAQEFGAIVTR
jgi:uncharacterized protein YkwD